MLLRQPSLFSVFMWLIEWMAVDPNVAKLSRNCSQQRPSFAFSSANPNSDCGLSTVHS